MSTRKICLSLIFTFMVALVTMAGAQTTDVRASSDAKRSIVGSWVVHVIPAQGPGAPLPFDAYFTYNSDEGFVETDPLAGGNGHGYWEKTSKNTVKWRMIRPLIEPNGNLAGSFDVIETITLTSKDEYTGVFAAKLLDPSGNLITTIPGETRGRRITLDE
jgi:hypothetical protein